MPLEATTNAIEQGIRERLHLGCQFYLSIKGQVIADLALGESRPGVELRNTDLMLWLSATKPLAAVAIAQLWERGLLDLDDPVAKHIPDFAANGKEAVTIRHLLTHTAGFRGVANTWSSGTWDQLIHRICNAPLETGWVPGKKAGYHVASSWFILGEIISLVSGKRPCCLYMHSEIFSPLRMTSSHIGIVGDYLNEYREQQRLALMYNTAKGEFDASYPGNEENNIASCRPGGNGWGPARELARLYECMLNGGRVASSIQASNAEVGLRTKILTRQTIEALTARHRVGMMDVTFQHIIDWGLGFIINSAHYNQPTLPYGFGPHASPRAFGHSGSQSSIGFADPEHHLACAILFNGMPGEAAHNQRINAVLAALYQDLGLAGA